VEEIKARREGTIEVVEALGELDMSNVDLLNDALKIALSDEKTSCLLDLAGLDFLDSTVIKALVRWSNDAQLSDREALAIVVGEDTPAARLVDLLGLTGRLPIFKTGAAARRALLDGQRARAQRSLEWLTDAELNVARSDAQSDSDTVGRRLDDITQEERRRGDEPQDRSR
jgi:anti-anti-sigma factor